MRNSFLFFTLLILCSCANTFFALDQKADVSTIGICVKFDEAVSDEIKTAVERNLGSFISEYNASDRKFNLFESSNSDSISVTIHILNTNLVSKQQQVTGVVVSTLGLSLPFIMIGLGAEFALFFYYFPRAISVTNVSLSDDIARTDGRTIRYAISSPAFLKKRERQIEKHGTHFSKALWSIFKNLEKSTL